MKKKFALSSLIILFSSLVLFYACKKDNNETKASNEFIAAQKLKINTWLDNQKSTMYPLKAQNVASLKENLQFDKLTTEQVDSGNQLIVIPVKKNYNSAHDLDQSVISTLLLRVDKLGNIS